MVKRKWLRAAWGVEGATAASALTAFLRVTAPELTCPRKNSSREAGMNQSSNREVLLETEILELKFSPLENMPTSLFFLERKKGGADTQLLQQEDPEREISKFNQGPSCRGGLSGTPASAGWDPPTESQG